ncbi:MAG: hypothetical protein ACI9MR_002994 [Myxococcota bacterium]|jgi:hypothetical protein
MNALPGAHAALQFQRVDGSDAEGGTRWRVADPTQGTIFWFSEHSFRILESLDGTRSVDEIAAHVGASDADARKSVQGLIIAFERAGLLAGARANQRSWMRVQSWMSDAKHTWGQLEAAVLCDVLDVVSATTEAATSDCALCKLSCCSYAIDVEQREVDDVIEAAAALTPPIERGTLCSVERPKGDAAFMLRRADHNDCCVVMDDAGRCRIHADQGFDRKPVACQFYPTVMTIRPDGPRTATRAGCAHPGTTREPGAVFTHRAMLAKTAQIAPGVVVRRAPDTVVLVGTQRFPWATWTQWESEALASIADETDAELAFRRVVTALHATTEADTAISGETVPHADDYAARSLVAALSQVIREGDDLDAEADALLAFASADPGHRSVAKPGVIGRWIQALDPLRFPSALAGLGVLRMVLGATDHHARGVDTPAEATASIVRSIHGPKVSIALGRAGVGVLEALARL